tara:strand:- start:147 stop:386 length:240 start_codon:yes stop_codon:yes gene_type:complete
MSLFSVPHFLRAIGVFADGRNINGCFSMLGDVRRIVLHLAGDSNYCPERIQLFRVMVADGSTVFLPVFSPSSSIDDFDD